jgi:hypothetical protein
VLGEVLAEMSAPASAGLPVEHAYRLRGPGREQGYVTEPHTLSAFEIGALADVAARGWRVTVEAAGALCLPGEILHIVIRPQPTFGGRRRGALRAMAERDPRAAVPTHFLIGDQLDGAAPRHFYGSGVMRPSGVTKSPLDLATLIAVRSGKIASIKLYRLLKATCELRSASLAARVSMELTSFGIPSFRNTGC